LKKPETAMIVKKCVHGAKMRQVDTLILGSACFHLLAADIQRKVGRRVKLVDAVGAQARAVSGYLAKRPDLARRLAGSGRRRFVVSDLCDQVLTSARLFYGRSLLLEPLPISIS
jgi:glutamate racemase